MLILFSAAFMFMFAGLAESEEASCDTSRYFCADRLNDGLGEAPRFVDRQTPRATMESLSYAARQGNWQAAAHLFDLSDLAPSRQIIEGPLLAEQLHTVIQRKSVVDWGNLPDRPDALDALASSDQAMAGEPRRSLLLWTLDVETHPVAIRLNRVAVAGQAPVWVFSSQTVWDIPALFERHGPSAIEEMLPDALVGGAAFGLLWWEVLALPVILILALLAGRMVWMVLNTVARGADRTVVTQVVRVARGPAATAAATSMLLIFGSYVLVF